MNIKPFPKLVVQFFLDKFLAFSFGWKFDFQNNNKKEIASYVHICTK